MQQHSGTTCQVSLYISKCAWINTMQQLNGIMQDNHFWSWKSRKEKDTCGITAIQAALISLASRWGFGIIEFWEVQRTSYPAHFTASSQTDVISPLLWVNSGAPDARAPLRICVQHNGPRVTHLRSGSILAMVLWGDALSAAYTFSRGAVEQHS